MKYLAVLGRQPKISLAELESLFSDVKQVAPELAEFSAEIEPNIQRLGGTLKLAKPILEPMPEFWKKLPGAGKIVIGVSDFSKGANAYLAQKEAMKWKRVVSKLGHNVRIVPNKGAVLSSATSFHNHLFGENKIELIKFDKKYYRVVGVQNIDGYVKRDQARPARDAKVGMLPPKLAQILIDLCGDLPAGSRLLDPFCGTGVVLQEAMLMGYVPYGTDISETMVEYSRKNLEWLRTRCQSSLFSGGAFATPAVAGSRRYSIAFCESSRFCTSSEMRTSSRFSRMFESAAVPPDPPEKERRPTTQHGAQKTSVGRDGALEKSRAPHPERILVQEGDATSYQWQPPINAVACEGYLGRPMSLPPAEIKLKQEKQECGSIILGFLKNLAGQIEPGTPVVMAVPAWLRPNGEYERLNLLDEIKNLGYNVKSFRNLGQEDLLYHREQQVVAREIIVLRKK